MSQEDRTPSTSLILVILKIRITIQLIKLTAIPINALGNFGQQNSSFLFLSFQNLLTGVFDEFYEH
ncbi:hypothetical protein [Burkholderia catarinensis]|uniref:hypothetical protein n=1 Tax=Burkholderia catarinensis TaxID=1108140 RepID=UPI0010080C48|nr:hypothetical protein [Burkholderia catarinensis]